MLVWSFSAGTIICLAYFLVIALYAGSSTSWIMLWLIGAILFAIVSQILRIFQKKKHKVPLWLPVSLVTLSVTGIIIVLIIQILIFAQVPEVANPNLDYIIVMGAGAREGEVSHTLKLRLDKALEYVTEQPDTVLVVSGVGEAETMRDYLVGWGVSTEQILVENRATSTVENIAYSKILIEEQPERREMEIGVLTSNFHLFRTRQVAKKQGLGDVSGIASESDRVLLLHFSIREGIAILKERLMGNI